MNIARDMTQLIGNTPMVYISKLLTDCTATIVAKLEYFNPFSSSKDRICLAMIEDAEKRGLLKPGSVVIEATSGNTGIALAFVCVVKGYRLILVMPDNICMERRKLLKALHAELVLTEGTKGMKGAIGKVAELTKLYHNSFVPHQFDNQVNAQIHKTTTGQEIWRDTDGLVDIFVAGVGTGGTITGIGSLLKSKKKECKVVAVEPEGSALLSGGKPGTHKIIGIGAGFIPPILDRSIIDEVITVSDKDARSCARALVAKEGIFAGISSGAAMHAAIKIAKRNESKDKTIVVLLPDSGERYINAWLWDDIAE